MEWNEKLQMIIDYVEEHLQREQNPVNTQEIAQIAGCSYGFFQKVFSYMNGMSFSEYVRSRKLTLAGYDLKSTDKKVVDISYQYGYDSPTSFTKAFQQFHGVTPTEARNKDIRLNVMPKMQIMTQQSYSWRLEQKPAFRLIGKKVLVSQKNGAHYTKIPEFWHQCQRDGTFSALIAMDTGIPQGMFGLVGAYDEETEEIEYAIMVISDNPLPDGYSEIRIPESTWAVFDCRGAVPQAIQNGWKYLNEEWLVKYPFGHADCPELEWYSSGNSFSKDYLSQIWIPVIDETV